ncbi:MAG: AraC family transcriptional regulator [Bacteroidales bacterium]|nr:AraC family transcriptional regulator [Bacteroidales bacterium]
MSTRALGLNYFKDDNCPVILYRVDRKHEITHEHDLTEINHYHDFVEIVIIIDGQGVQVVEAHEYLVSAGDVFVLQGNQSHYFKEAGKVDIVNVMFEETKKINLIPDRIKQLEGYNALFILEPNYRERDHFKNKLKLNREELAKIESIINEMFQEMQNREEGYDIILRNRFQELIVLLCRHYTKIGSTEARSLIRIGKVIEFLENNPDRKIYIKDMASLANMSVRNFQRNFVRALGLSPINYLIQVRLQRARKLLRETDLKIMDIADITGFTDISHFIKCFKKYFKVTPYKYRMQFLNDIPPEMSSEAEPEIKLKGRAV